jgi:hypothetical protein
MDKGSIMKLGAASLPAGGADCGHGETYVDPKDIILWWSEGGVLHGQSPARLAFFKKVVADAPAAAGEPLKRPNTWGVGGEYLIYLWDRQHAKETVNLPADARFKADVIDTREMTITPLPGEFSGRAEIPLSTKPYMAIRITKVR